MIIRIKIYDLSTFGEVDRIINAIIDYEIDDIAKDQLDIIQRIIDGNDNYVQTVYEVDQYMKSIGAKELIYDIVLSNLHEK